MCHLKQSVLQKSLVLWSCENCWKHMSKLKFKKDQENSKCRLLIVSLESAQNRQLNNRLQ